MTVKCPSAPATDRTLGCPQSAAGRPGPDPRRTGRHRRGLRDHHRDRPRRRRHPRRQPHHHPARSQHQSLPGGHRRMSRRTRLSQPGPESSPLDNRAMFRGSSISSSHGRGSTPCSIARRSTCPFAASLSAPGSRTMPEACSIASTCSPAARRFLISASTDARHALNSRRLSNAATTTCRRSRRAGSYR